MVGPKGADPPSPNEAFDVFAVALGLGLTSFGGPSAHLGYFERVYVQRRRWLSVDDYAGLVALCQMVPGPASSQVSFLIGLRRASWPGAFAAWLGFTLPSALIMFAFAWLAPRLAGPTTQAALHGLKLVAVAVLAHAILGMARKLCPDLRRTVLALLAATLLLLFRGGPIQLLAMAIGAVGGVLLCRNLEGLSAPPVLPIGRRTGLWAGAVFLVLLIALPLAARAAPGSLLDLATIFYKAGALVFGGGHVVAPLLRDALVPRWLSNSVFLSGYGAVQAVPGPLFTFASYLGAMIAPPSAGPSGAAVWSVISLVFMFLPGMLLAIAGLPLWSWAGHHPMARGALAGVNAAVVGVLGAALYNPIWTSAILSPQDLAIALIAFVLLARWRAPPILIVAFCVMAAVALGRLR